MHTKYGNEGNWWIVLLFDSLYILMNPPWSICPGGSPLLTNPSFTYPCWGLLYIEADVGTVACVEDREKFILVNN